MNTAKVPKWKEPHNKEAIAARKAELGSYKPDLLKKFAIKRGVIPTETSKDSELIDAIVNLEFESK